MERLSSPLCQFHIPDAPQVSRPKGRRCALFHPKSRFHQSGWSHIHRIIVIPTHSGTETTIARMTIAAIHRNSSVIGSKTDPSFVLPSISRCAAIPSRSPSKNPSTARINLMQCPLARSISGGTIESLSSKLLNGLSDGIL